MELTKQAGQFASSPMMDPSKNPELAQENAIQSPEDGDEEAPV